MQNNNLLIIKNGALGDVVRTAYFVRYLKGSYGGKVNIFWKTIPISTDLLTGTILLDKIVFSYEAISHIKFDVVYSLDDEVSELYEIKKLSYKKIVGAYIDGDKIKYTADSAEWYDMGLISRYGKEKADLLKKTNKQTHMQIFSKIFGLEDYEIKPSYIGKKIAADILDKDDRIKIGVNSFAGSRWESKGLSTQKLHDLIGLITGSEVSKKLSVILLGVGDDYEKNRSIANHYACENIYEIDTSESIAFFAKLISELDYLVTADTLALHLAIANSIPYCAFFAPTSAKEIEDTAWSTKIISESEDYCSYLKYADTSTITPEKIFKTIECFVNDKISNNLIME